MIGQDCLLVEKNGDIKNKHVSNESELYKKCGFKKEEGFEKHAEWNVSVSNDKYNISLFGKAKGKANTENKYDFPPPADNILLFGNCILTSKMNGEPNDLTSDLWEKIYEKLFGGFEDLDNTAEEDENEVDELANVPKSMKTKTGYLKDGFIVDDDDEVLQQETDSTDTVLDSNSGYESDEDNIIQELSDLHLEDVGSELEEEEYLDEEEDM